MRIGFNPDVSVVVCTYNRAHLLHDTLVAFADLPDTEFCEIIVVDNNSTDDTSTVVARLCQRMESIVPLRYVFESVQGLSRARNTGTQHAHGDVIAFIDDDAVPHRNWLRAIREFFSRQPDVSAVGGPIFPKFEISRPDWLKREMEGYYSILYLGDEERLFPKDQSPFGANMAFTRAALCGREFPESLGRKGASLLSGEEASLFSAIRSNGGQLFYVPEMAVTHFIPSERLNPAWLLTRCRAGGVSKVLAANSSIERSRLWTTTLAKFLILKCAATVYDRSHDMMFQCRMNSVSGALQALRRSGPAPLH